jgi:chromosome segregation ATPase
VSEQLADLAGRGGLAGDELLAAQQANAAEVGPVLRGLEEEIVEASGEGASTRAALEAIEGTLGNLGRRGENLRRTLGKHGATLERLREERAAAAREPAKVALQMEGVERVYEGLKGETGRVGREVEALRAAYTGAEAAAVASTGEGALLRSKLAAHSAEVGAREREVGGVEGLLAAERALGRELLAKRVACEGEKERAKEAAGVARTALTQAQGAYERAKRELKRAGEELNVVRGRRGPLEAELKAKAGALASATAATSSHKASLAALKREMDVLVGQFLREEAGEKRGREAVAGVAGECAEAEGELGQWLAEEAAASQHLTALKAARDAKRREVVKVENATREAVGVAEAREAVVADATARAAASRKATAQTLALHEAATAEKGAAVAAAAALHAQALQLGETRRVLESERVVLEGEARAKERALAGETHRYAALLDTRDRAREKVNKLKAMDGEAVGELEAAGGTLERLKAEVREAQREGARLARLRASLLEARAAAGIRKMDAEEEYALLMEKARVQEGAIEKGEMALARVKEEITAIGRCKAELEGELAGYQRRIRAAKGSTGTAELATLQALAAATWEKVDALSGAVSDPRAGAGRTRMLEGEDPQDTDLAAMVEATDLKLSARQEEILRMEVALERLREEKERLLREAEGGPNGEMGAVAGAREVNAMAQKVRETGRLLMASVAELSLMQALEMKAAAEAEAALAAKEQGEKRMEAGLPPSDAALMKLGAARRASSLSTLNASALAAGEK